MKKRKLQKIVAFLLILSLVWTLLPGNLWATEISDNVREEDIVQMEENIEEASIVQEEKAGEQDITQEEETQEQDIVLEEASEDEKIETEDLETPEVEDEEQNITYEEKVQEQDAVSGKVSEGEEPETEDLEISENEGNGVKQDTKDLKNEEKDNVQELNEENADDIEAIDIVQAEQENEEKQDNITIEDLNEKVDEIATQSKKGKFSRNYHLTGNAVDDIISVAKAQVGKTGSQLGYTEEWCADFVSDCADLANQGSAIPRDGYCLNLQTKIRNAGGDYININSVRKGDIVFYGSNGSSHVEIVYAVNNGRISSIGGNSGSGSNLYVRTVRDHATQSQTITKAMRPNYKSSISSPTNPTISQPSKSWYDLSDTIEITAHADNATKYQIVILKNGGQVGTRDMSGGKISFNVAEYGTGYYTVYASCSNSAGTVNTGQVGFFVSEECNLGNEFYAQIKHLSTGLALTNQNGNVSGENETGAENQIWKFVRLSNGAYQIQNKADGFFMDVEGIADTDGANVYIWSEYVGGGNQQFYIYRENNAYYLRPAHSNTKVLDLDLSSHNLGIWTKTWETDWAPQRFDIVKLDLNGVLPKNLGDNFYAYIKHESTGLALTNKNGNISGETATGEDNQIWKFTRLSNGAYKIQNKADGSFMDVEDIADKDGANVYVWSEYVGGANQQFFVYEKNNIYYLRPAHSQIRVLDMDLDNHNLGIWNAIGWDWKPQRFLIQKDVHIEHKIVVDAAVAPTCTQKGLTEGSHCSVCKKVIKAQKEVPALGHNYESKVTKEPTCTEDGKKTYTCKRCKHTYTESIKAKGHKTVVDAAVAPTCTQKGLTEGSHCSVCKKVIKAQKEVSALGHNYESKVTKEPTKTEDGEKTYTCKRCKHTYTEVIKATGHEENQKSVKISVASVNSLVGEKVKIPVSIIKNPGIAGLSFDIGYDNKILTLKAIEKTSFTSKGILSNNETAVNWYAQENIVGDGELFILVFEVAKEVDVDSTKVSLSLHEGKKNLVDENGKYIEASYEQGEIQFKKGLDGDINGDGDLTIGDVVLLNRYVLGRSSDLEETTKKLADVNKDGDITIGDVVLLNRMVLGKVQISS